MFSWCTSGSESVVLNRAHSDLELIRWLTVVPGTLQKITDVDEGWTYNAGLDTCIRFAAYPDFLFKYTYKSFSYLRLHLFKLGFHSQQPVRSDDQPGERNKLALTMARTKEISGQSTESTDDTGRQFFCHLEGKKMELF